MSGRKNLHSCGCLTTTTMMPLTKFQPLIVEGHSTISSTTISLQTCQIAIAYLAHLIMEYIDQRYIPLQPPCAQLIFISAPTNGPMLIKFHSPFSLKIWSTCIINAILTTYQAHF
jgi:hypothetical protein